MAAGYEVGFDHILIHLPHCQFVCEFNFFTNWAICTSLGRRGYVDRTHSLISMMIDMVFTLVCSLPDASYLLNLCHVGLQLKTSHLQPRPDLQFQIRPFEKSDPVQP